MNFLVILFVVMPPAATQPSDFAAGRAAYRAGEFKQAVSHFERALQKDPASADGHYWLGRSYETLADISIPFGRRSRARARLHLAKAVELAPKRTEYRRELFEFLLDAGDSRGALAVLASSGESDPDYDSLLSLFQQTRRLNASFHAITVPWQFALPWR